MRLRVPMTAGWIPRLMLSIAAIVTFAISGGRAYCQTPAPFEQFGQLTGTALSQLQLKLTWVGDQTTLCPTLVIKASGVVDLQKFAACRQSGWDYGNDDFGPDSAAASVADLGVVIDNLGMIPHVVAGGAADEGSLSVGLASPIAGVDRCFDVIVDSSTAVTAFAAIRSGLAGSLEAAKRVREMACGLGLLAGTTPTSVNSQVRLAFGSARRNPATGEYLCLAKVTNISASTIQPPLSLVLQPEDGSLELIDLTGRTCLLQGGGLPYIDVDIGAGLTPGASVSCVLRFRNPDRRMIRLYWTSEAGRIQPQLYAGPGER